MDTTTITLVTVNHHEAADHEAIGESLDAFNRARAGDAGHLPLAILVKDQVNDTTLGGLWGETVYDWLFVKLLVVPEALRGIGVGRRIMAEAERVAAARGNAGIWLDTFEFQARGFYEKLGFEVFGTLPDHPRGMSRFFLRKQLNQADVGGASRSAG